MRFLNLIRLKRKIFFAFLTVIVLICLVSFYFLNKKSHKILLIGLDGADWKVISPLREEGKIPNIKKLMDSGCWGKLETIQPLTSEVIWTTIATGKSPDVHGITDSLVEDPDTNDMIPITSNFRKVKAIWNILSEHKKKVGMVGYRVTWPPERVNGVMISERAYESNYFSMRYAEPSFKSLCTERIFNKFKQEKNVPEILMGDEKWVFNLDFFMANFSKYLLKNKKFDFFCVYLRGIDAVSHYYWECMFPRDKEVATEDIKYKDVIKDYYIWCDRVIGDLLKILDKDTTVIIVSDHGFDLVLERLDKYFFHGVNNLLKACGLEEFSHNSKIVRLENTTEIDKNNYKKNIKITGTLSRKEFIAVREKAKNILKNIKFIETGQTVFKIPTDTEIGFLLDPNNEYINNNLDHHLLINNREYKILDFFKRPMSGDHANTAIIIVNGKNIRQHQELIDVSVYDITPTLLYLSGLPLAVDMPGKVNIDAIDEAYLIKNPLRYIDTYEEDKKQPLQKPYRLPEDEEKIKERMRSLGYIN